MILSCSRMFQTARISERMTCLPFVNEGSHSFVAYAAANRRPAANAHSIIARKVPSVMCVRPLPSTLTTHNEFVQVGLHVNELDCSSSVSAFNQPATVKYLPGLLRHDQF